MTTDAKTFGVVRTARQERIRMEREVGKRDGLSQNLGRLLKAAGLSTKRPK